jgi:hypothetical protein
MTRELVITLALGMLGAGCSFEAPRSEGALSMNTCSSNEQCGTDGLCNGSMCVARTVSDSLRVYLHVAPVQQSDGPAPVATILPELNVERGSMTKAWTLPAPATVFGTVRDGDLVVDADVTLTAQPEIPGLPTTALVAVSTDTPDNDFEVRIPGKGEYTIRVRPTDTSLPPYVEVRRLEAGDTIAIDYSELFEHTIEISADIDDKLVVRAHDVATGAPISSTADVVNKRATLRFVSDPGEFRLVVRPAGAYEPGGALNDGCDHDTPVLPTFSINSSALTKQAGALQVVLPPAPKRESYKGRVQLCDAPSIGGAAAPESLPVTLRSRAIILDDPTGMWTAEVETNTEATIEDAPVFSYCVDVFSGDYEIVVTPPESAPCEIFAQTGIVLTPNESTDENPVSFAAMNNAAQLVGELTADMMPLVATTVDVQSLGRPVGLHEFDAALTRFSRSRQTTTDETGAFRVAVDRGSYDVTIKPPSGSGYAWYVRRDVEIGSNGEFRNDIEMGSPVAIDCKIRYEGQQDGDSMAGAQITAYAVIADDELGERAIPIGKADADDDGQFMLLLPPKVLAGWSSSGVEP